MMSMGVLGALIGLAIGIADVFILGLVKARIEQQRPTEGGGGGLVIGIVQISQLIFFPVAGWYAGTYLL
ncbi:hypothetical protein U0C82_10150 [Fulvimarina sp. 2208YS6-2-32]|uniref:Uncharacterized protein n=1 Tax=Fulvimarina uroteuthidis TaxID=3098149 RepID=A0ABU5I2A5_9HYPH|nr:hypothetical protein [Fulvimarina sp. 2208YS6-2-32]MDY8109500.1 hypothetical protein [Fulvimarina sp. 2208YS6-2-32]